jgi:hypothetical protein
MLAAPQTLEGRSHRRIDWPVDNLVDINPSRPRGVSWEMALSNPPFDFTLSSTLMPTSVLVYGTVKAPQSWSLAAILCCCALYAQITK